MKVCLVMASLGKGGLEKHVAELAEALHQKQTEVYVIADERTRQMFSNQVIFIPHNFSRSRFNPLSLVQLLHKLAQINPDIVHAQANKAGQQIALLRRWIKAKCVVTIHNLKRSLAFVQKFDGVIGVSQQICAGINHHQKVTIYNGIADSLSPNSPQDHKSGIHKWLAVGRLVPAKGFDLLIEAMTHVEGTLTIAGAGPEKSRLIELIDRFKLQSRVKLLGHIDHPGALYDSHDAVIISSRKEGFSYVFAEALMHRLPVVATNVPVANEVLDSRWIADEISAEGISKVMLRLQQERPDFTPYYDFAARQFTLASMCERTAEFYQELYYEHP